MDDLSECYSVFCAGKSTILNHLFRTSFKEMDAFAGRFVISYLKH